MARDIPNEQHPKVRLWGKERIWGGRGGEGRGLECFVWNQNPLVGQAVTEEVWFVGAPMVTL